MIKLVILIVILVSRFALAHQSYRYLQATSPSNYPTGEPTAQPTAFPSEPNPTGQPTFSPTSLITCVVVKIEVNTTFFSLLDLEKLLVVALERAIPILCSLKVTVYTPIPHNVCGARELSTINKLDEARSLELSAFRSDELAATRIVTFDMTARK
jgi:hypothetical protein